MILNSITLHNFMSYADATLDFSAITVACLSGQNGAGKSAVLDAITWALWESARSSSDELIRLGHKEMWVDLHFTQEGQQYRVRRLRQKVSAKAGSKLSTRGTLEFQVLQENLQDSGLGSAEAKAITTGFKSAKTETAKLGAVALQAETAITAVSLAAQPNQPGTDLPVLSSGTASGGTWRSLTGAHMKETQKAIDELLRMDYDTFINSAYLRQGRADEFTMRAPGERKQVLCEILGLSYFDRLQEMAKDLVRQLKSKAEWLDQALQIFPETEQRLSANQEQFHFAQEQLSEATHDQVECQRLVNGLQEKVQHLRLTCQKLEQTEQQARTLQADIDALVLQERDLEEKAQQLRWLLSQSPEIESAAREFEQLKQSVEKLDQTALLAQELLTRKMEVQSKLAQLRSRLEVEADHQKSLLVKLTGTISKLETDTADAAKIEQAHQQYRQLSAREAELALKQEAFVKLSQRAGDLQAAVSEARIRLEAELGQKQLSIADCQALLLARDSLQSEQETLTQETKALEQVEAEFDLVEERGLSAKSKLESVQLKVEQLKAQQRETSEKINELTCHSDSSLCPLCSAPIVDRAAVIARYQQQIVEIDSQISALGQETAELENERLLLRKQYLELKHKLDGRKALDTQIGQFNERLSAIERGATTLEKLNSECQHIQLRLDTQQYAEIERESLIAIKAESHKLEFDPLVYSDLQAQIRSQRYIETKYQQLKKDLSELKELQEALPAQQTKVEQLMNQLDGETYGSDLRQAISAVHLQLAELQYEKQAHLDLKAQLSALMPKIEKFKDLQRAMAELPVIEQTLLNCRTMLQTKQELLPELASNLDSYQAEIAALPQITKDYEEAQPRLYMLQARREDLAKRNAVLESEGTQLQAKLKELENQRQTLDATRQEIEDFSFLAEAFGKKGIQAVIIENAIPEIEAEANRILSRLTENKMHIALVTQQRTKSGGIIETLDLLIGDEVGTRNYELYSGGEAFKVNFSVRVALARLLARRSGAKLETLIIDEGFGSQDDNSRSRLVKAIRSIQSDFARILVITHIADVRELFPAQIQVTKTNGISSLQVVC